MKYVIDIEANALTNPDRIWLVVMKNIDTGEYRYYYDLTKRKEESERYIRDCEALRAAGGELIGHNLLGYDWPVLCATGQSSPAMDGISLVDTLILSKLIDYSRKGHSIEDYGVEFGHEKIKFTDFSKYSPEMLEYCKRDCDICEKIYLKYKKYVSNPAHAPSIELEHQFQYVVNSLHDNGFAFNSSKATKLLEKVSSELAELDGEILTAFPPRLKLIREVTPKGTKYGTISKASIPVRLRDSIEDFSIDAPFSYCEWVEFNPSSHKQLLSVLTEAKWKPVDKTQTHIETERSYQQLKKQRSTGLDSERKVLYDRLQELRITGWKVNENNLETLPPNAPKAARLLARRILLEARRRTLTEWLNLVHLSIKVEKKSIKTIGGVKTIAAESGISNGTTDSPSKIMIGWLRSKKANVLSVDESDQNFLSITVTAPKGYEGCFAKDVIHALDGLKETGLRYTIISERIKGNFQGIGAWTHRMAHQNPNTANIPNEFDTAGKKKLLGKELRSLWSAPRNRLLVGCDAEGIQLRIFAHYINDPEFTLALVKGKKDDKTDPHSLNQRILGSVCKSRSAAKRFIYALLLGAGLGKLSEILGCTDSETQQALDRLLGRYTGWASLKEDVFPKDAKRGWFVGLDGRKVRIPGENEGSRRHLAMSGYLQNGEAVCMKLATLKWVSQLKAYDAKLVNFVHDEWQVECPNDVSVALTIGNLMSDSLRQVGEDLGLHCPLAGSIWNDDLKDYTIGTNWSVTH